jgi:hypothetical protein
MPDDPDTPVYKHKKRPAPPEGEEGRFQFGRRWSEFPRELEQCRVVRQGLDGAERVSLMGPSIHTLPDRADNIKSGPHTLVRSVVLHYTFHKFQAWHCSLKGFPPLWGEPQSTYGAPLPINCPGHNNSGLVFLLLLKHSSK